MAGKKKRKKSRKDVSEKTNTVGQIVLRYVLLVPFGFLCIWLVDYLWGSGCAKRADWMPKTELDGAVSWFLLVVGTAFVLYIIALFLRWTDQEKSQRGKFKMRGYFRIETAVSIGIAISLHKYYELWHWRGYVPWIAEDAYINVASSIFFVVGLGIAFFLLDQIFDRGFWRS